MAAPLGAYMVKHGVLPASERVTFNIEQGLEMHRPSWIRVEVGHDGQQITSIRIGAPGLRIGPSPTWRMGRFCSPVQRSISLDCTGL
jgi:predicted PhzF superfamily epimerase YddE/YHI9